MMNVNEKIRAARVLLIGDDGQNIGNIPLREAIVRAKEVGLDLVEVGGKEVPVCRIMDFGKYKYEQSKKDKMKSKNQTVQLTKEIKFRPNTDNNDLIYRAKQADQFLKDKDKIKISVRFRGREAEHISGTSRAIIDRFLSMLTTPYNVESAPNFEGRAVTVLITP